MRSFVINQLTQFSTWLGFTLLVSALFLPRNLIVLLAVIIICLQDDKLTKFFAAARKQISEWWTP